MPSEICHRCGSRSFRADRALAGRIICTKCGIPYNKSQVYNLKLYKNNLLRLSKNKFLMIIFFIILLVIFL